jgi:hypothetical protein
MLLIEHTVKASMKQIEYNVVVCFSENTVVACSCDCQAGCYEDGRVLCVHILPVIYQLTFLLFDGLADNILVELSNQWTAKYEQQVSSVEMKNEIRKYFLILKTAAQQYEDADEFLDLEALMHKFLVGTERDKFQKRQPLIYSQTNRTYSQYVHVVK